MSVTERSRVQVKLTQVHGLPVRILIRIEGATLGVELVRKDEREFRAIGTCLSVEGRVGIGIDRADRKSVV